MNTNTNETMNTINNNIHLIDATFKDLIDHYDLQIECEYTDIPVTITASVKAEYLPKDAEPVVLTFNGYVSGWEAEYMDNYVDDEISYNGNFHPDCVELEKGDESDVQMAFAKLIMEN